MSNKKAYTCFGCYDAYTLIMPSDYEFPRYCPYNDDYETRWKDSTKELQSVELPEGYLKE